MVNQDKVPSGEGLDDLHDYNSVPMAEFNKNPSHYLIGTGPIPLAIRKHGKVQGIYMQVEAYNDLLTKIRNLRLDQAKLVQLLDAASPGLLDRHRDLKDLNVKVALLPKWPILKSMPKRVPISRYPDLWLKAEAEEAALEMARVSGNYRLPEPDSEEDWGKYAVRHSHEFADGFDDEWPVSSDALSEHEQKQEVADW
jgi:hypothetical protein